MMGRTSAEYGLWFAITSIGYMGGNFIASRLSQRLGLRRMILGGLALQVLGVLGQIVGFALFPAAGPELLFGPQIIISLRERHHAAERDRRRGQRACRRRPAPRRALPALRKWRSALPRRRRSA